jgi:hypothetical protein
MKKNWENKIIICKNLRKFLFYCQNEKKNGEKKNHGERKRCWNGKGTMVVR